MAHTAVGSRPRLRRPRFLASLCLTLLLPRVLLPLRRHFMAPLLVLLRLAPLPYFSGALATFLFGRFGCTFAPAPLGGFGRANVVTTRSRRFFCRAL